MSCNAALQKPYSTTLIIALALAAMGAFAQAQECVLEIRVSSPEEWHAYRINESVRLDYGVYNAVNGSRVWEFNKTELLDGLPLPSNPFVVASEGLHYLSVAVNASGCVPRNATVGFYAIFGEGPRPVSEMNLFVAALVAALALFILLQAEKEGKARKAGRQANPRKK